MVATVVKKGAQRLTTTSDHNEAGRQPTERTGENLNPRPAPVTDNVNVLCKQVVSLCKQVVSTRRADSTGARRVPDRTHRGGI